MPALSWDAIQIEIKRIVSEAEKPFDPDTIANAKDLIEICRVNTPLPSSVAKGYWSTISLYWPGFEIEVFDDRLEIYRFNEDKSTDIWYEEHRPQNTFSERFLNELAGLREHRGEAGKG